MVGKFKILFAVLMFISSPAWAKTNQEDVKKVRLSEEFLNSLNAEQRDYLKEQLKSVLNGDEFEEIDMDSLETIEANNSIQPTKGSI